MQVKEEEQVQGKEEEEQGKWNEAGQKRSRSIPSRCPPSGGVFGRLLLVGLLIGCCAVEMVQSRRNSKIDLEQIRVGVTKFGEDLHQLYSMVKRDIKRDIERERQRETT